MTQQSLAEIVLAEQEGEAGRPFTYFTYWMIVHGVACWLAGRRIPILAIELRCAEPDYCDDYRVMFSENLRFARPRTRMILSADCLDLPIKRSAEELQRFLGHAPANILVKYRDAQSFSSRIRHDLRQLPAQQWPETEGLALQLCMSASTLRRRLAEEGQTYQALKDSVRKELAIAWLAEPAGRYRQQTGSHRGQWRGACSSPLLAKPVNQVEGFDHCPKSLTGRLFPRFFYGFL